MSLELGTEVWVFLAGEGRGGDDIPQGKSGDWKERGPGTEPQATDIHGTVEEERPSTETEKDQSDGEAEAGSKSITEAPG